MKSCKRAISLVIALIMVVGMIPVSVFSTSAETSDNYSGQCGDGAYWEFDVSTGTLTVSGYGNMYDYWDGWIAESEEHQYSPWYEHKVRIKSVVIESGITSVSDSAFAVCPNLTSVAISDTVASIGRSSFASCGSLAAIEIPGSVKVIGRFAFESCGKLSQLILNEGLETIEDGAVNHTAITSIYIPSTTVELSDYHEYVLEKIDRYDNPFLYCRTLKTIEVGQDNPIYAAKNGALYHKGEDVLLSAPKIRGSFTVPEGTRWIAYGCFGYCTNVTQIKIPSSVEKVGGEAFCDCSSIKEIDLPEGVKWIGEGVFAGCTSLESISIPSTLEEITFNARLFVQCNKLSSLDVAENNQHYSSCNGVIYDKNKTILYACIPGASGGIDVPSTVKWIERDAFVGCGYLTEINLPATVESISYDADNDYHSYHCFAECYSNGAMSRSPISYLCTINVATDNAYFSSDEGVLYSKDKKTLIAFPSGRAGNFTIPNGTTTIGESAFTYSNISNLVIPESVCTIKELAIFGFRKLSSICILNSNCALEHSMALVKTDMDNCDPTIYAPMESTAHQYARENYFTFVNINHSSQKYTEENLCLHYSIDKNNIELGEAIHVGADYTRGNSFGMRYDGDMRWELSNPEVLQVESYSSSAALLYFKAIGLGTCEITLYLDGEFACSDTVTVKVSDETLLVDNSEHVLNSSAFSTLSTARDTCKEIIDGCDGANRFLASFFHSVENGLGVGVLTKEALAAAGVTTSMSEDAEDQAVEMIMMELIGAEDTVGSATKKIEKTYKFIKSGYGTATLDLDEFFRTVSNSTDFSVEQIKEFHNRVDSFTEKTDIAFDVLDITLSAILITQFELETIKDMQNATAYGGPLYCSLDRLYEKRENLVAYATSRFLKEQAINCLNDLIGELGGPTYKVAKVIGYWAKLVYDAAGGLDAEDYLVAQNAWAYAGYLYNYSLRSAQTPESFERYYTYYVAAVKAALKSAVAISRSYQLTNIADGLYAQIVSSCSYDSYLDSVRDDLMNVCSVSKETLENGKVFANYGGGIASYSLLDGEDEDGAEGLFSIPAYIDGQKIEGISDYGFTGISDVRGVLLPQTIEMIGEYAFSSSGIDFVHFNSGLTTIGKGAFWNCANLQFLLLPETLREVHSYSFAECNKIKEVTFGKNVELVASRAFENCSNLTVVCFDSENTVIEENAFANCGHLVIYGHEGSTAQTFAYTYGYDFVAYENTVVDMKIVSSANQQEMVAGDQVNTDGLTIEMTYMDGTTEVIQEGWTAVCDSATAGEKNVFICYKNGTTSYPVMIHERKLSQIRLQEEELELYISDTYQLSVLGNVLLPLEELVWKSDIASVVTVNGSGLITCHATGNATISVCDWSGTVLDVCEISVVNKEIFESTGEVIKTSFFSPSKAGYYSYCTRDSAETITAVLYNSNGEIVGADCGYNINICSWLVDDEAYFVEIYTADSNSVEIEVLPSVAAEYVVISVEEYSDMIGAEYKLDAYLEPYNAIGENITWSSSDDDIVSVNQDGKISLKKSGGAIITATTENGLIATCSVTVEDYPALTAGESATVTLNQDCPNAYFCFTPDEDGFYAFYSYNNDGDTYGYILDADMNQLCSDDDSGDGSNFKARYQMTAGTTYILAARLYNTGESGTFDVCIERITYISRLEITSMPAKTEYVTGFVNDAFSLKGLKLKAYMSDGATTEWTYGDDWYIGDEYLSCDTSAIEETGEVVISSEYASVTLPLTIIDNPVDHLEIVTGTSYSYIENYDGYIRENENGDYFYYYTNYPEDAVVKIVYKDGTSVTNYVGQDVDGYGISWNSNQPNHPWVVGSDNPSVVSYLGVTVNLPITVKENIVDSIEIVSGNLICIENINGYTDSRYDETTGEYIDFYQYYFTMPSDIMVKINYSDGTSLTANIHNDVDGYTFNWNSDQYETPWTLGDHNYVTVSYLGVETKLVVSVVENPVAYIVIDAVPTRNYVYGDAQWGDTYSDGTYEFYPTDMEGLVFTVCYTDGTSKVFSHNDIDENRKIDGFDYELSYDGYNAEVGNFPVRFTYMGRYADYTVVLKECPVESIAVTKNPAKMTYENTYYPDFIGMQCTIAYVDGTSRIVDITEDNLKYSYNPNEGLMYKVQVGDDWLWIDYDYDDSGKYYYASFFGKNCRINEMSLVENREVGSIELSNVSDNGDGMTIQLTYDDGTHQMLTMQIADYFRYEDGVIEGYGKTENGILYYSIIPSQDSDGTVVGYTVYLLGKDTYVQAHTEIIAPTLTLNYPTLAFEDEILYNVYFNVDDLTSVVEMGLVTFADRNYEGTIADALEIIPGYVANADGSYTASTNGIPAKMLSDAVFFKVYAKLADGTYVYSDVVGYHAVAYANTILNSNASAKAKALVVAMLNYGAAAQVNFNYKADALMDANLTADQLALVDAYSESMVAEVPAVGAKAGQFVMNGGYTDIHPTVSFEGAFSINYYFTPKYTPDDGVMFYYWNLNDFNNAEVLTPGNATGSVKMTSTGSVYTNPIEGIAAKQIDEPVYVAGLYTNGGTTYYTPVIGYSLGAYCKNIATNGNAFGAATAVYGYYAKAYFAS